MHPLLTCGTVKGLYGKTNPWYDIVHTIVLRVHVMFYFLFVIIDIDCRPFIISYFIQKFSETMILLRRLGYGYI